VSCFSWMMPVQCRAWFMGMKEQKVEKKRQVDQAVLSMNYRVVVSKSQMSFIGQNH